MASYQEILVRIHDLSEEQHELYIKAARKGLSDSQRRRLVQIKADLNTLWLKRKNQRPRFTDSLDLLMQKRWQRRPART